MPLSIFAPVPPFTAETAAQKIRLDEDAWNTRKAAVVVQAFTKDSDWRNRTSCLLGREAIETFLSLKFRREFAYRLIKEVWTFQGSRIAVRFVYEWCDDSGEWFRSYGNENCEFSDDGLMCRRIASINDRPIKECERQFRWLIGRRPDGYPSLHDLGL